MAIWSSAPFLHNNALGIFNGDPSVSGRLQAFQDAAEKLLWPEKRLGPGSIWRTQNECYLSLRKEYLPKPAQRLADAEGWLRIGPIPQGMPVNLLANLKPDAAETVKMVASLTKAFATIKAHNLVGQAANAELLKTVPALLAANKCPDFIEDKGHYFGTELADDDKRALIEFLKTM